MVLFIVHDYPCKCQFKYVDHADVGKETLADGDKSWWTVLGKHC